MVSFLKAMYGDAAKKENDFGFHYLPKIDRKIFLGRDVGRMYNGQVKGLFAFGMNGVAIGPNSHKNIEALKKADWLVVCEIFPDETSEFWKSPGITPDEMKKINTTVYRLPGAGFAEKDGTFVNSARWLQWKYAALPPPGDAKVDQEILARIFLKVRELYQERGRQVSRSHSESHMVLHRSAATHRSPKSPKRSTARRSPISTDPKHRGITIKAGQQLPGFAWLRDDGTTACGNWLYSGSWTEAGAQTAAPRHRGSVRAWHLSELGMVVAGEPPRDVQPRLVRSSGKPWDPARKQVWWNEAARTWVGNDVPDFKADSNPKDHMGPFIMNPEGVGRMFAPLGAFAEGPFPEHYEPIESPIANPLHPNQSTNPVVKKFKSPHDKFGTPEQGFNIVCTTYRLTEHYHYWTKNNPMNVQLVPEPFVEIPVELAGEMGIAAARR